MTTALIDEIEILREIKDREHSQDCWQWACDQVQTIDEARQCESPWPVDKVYLKELLDYYEAESLIAIPKSRRLMVSWSIALWSTWRARYHPYNAILIQSEKEEKSAYVIDKRCKYIEDHLIDPSMARSYHEIRTKAGMVGRMTYDDTGSYIQAIAQGAAQVRGYTLSALIMDECEIQEKAHAALAAALPLIEDSKNAKLILIGTSNGPGGVLATMCRDVGFVKFS